jgi:c-di-GMP-binding flagellar brake protein YcgR
VVKPLDSYIERRRYIRLKVPVEIKYAVSGDSRIRSAVSKNISADGLRLETADKDIKKSDILELKLSIPGASNPVHAKASVVWKKRLSLVDGAPFDLGLEFNEIEEDNKNTFLKFFCDLIYELPKIQGGE